MFSEIYEMLGDDIGGRFCVTFVPGRSAVLQGYKKMNKKRVILLQPTMELLRALPLFREKLW